jgi:DDE superfamily endonuclease
LVEDETDLLLFPPLRSAWGLRGVPLRVLLSGRNARRIVLGAMNLRTGHRLFQVHSHHKQQDFHDFLRLIHRHYRGWHVALLLDEDPSHTAHGSQQLAAELNIELLWLPKRCPELNPLDKLWGQAKTVVSANFQRPTIDAHVSDFLEYLTNWTPKEALQLSGVLSKRFWLQSLL